MITIYNKSNRSTYSAYLRRWNEAESQEEKEAAGSTEEQLSGQKPKARR